MRFMTAVASVGAVAGLALMFKALATDGPGQVEAAEATARDGIRCLLPLAALLIGRALERRRARPPDPPRENPRVVA